MADYKTVTGYRRSRTGNKKQVTGTFTADNSCDVQTGLGCIRFVSVTGSGNPDNDFTVLARNTTTTTDNAMDAKGSFHIEGAQSAAYFFCAIGV